MQVDTKELRTAATTLRDEVAEQLRKAGIQAGGPERDFRVAGAFDSYTTPGPYRAAVAAWAKETEVLAEAARQLADALEAAADDYDASDARAAGRLAGSR
jgi:DNA-binding ferritin-like protein